MIFLGIDTSCYTTSMAAIDENGNILFDHRIPLVVPQGKKGLRQSDMVFAHLKNIDGVSAYVGGLTAVGASVKPRPAEHSYMPVFTVSEKFGRSLALLSGADFFALTHQHGHIGAALIGNEVNGETLALHVSGGTTEILTCTVDRGIVKNIETIGGTLDISAGQLIDRLAQCMGMPFPGGASIEAAAIEGTPFSVKTCVKGMNANFSGIETCLVRKINVEQNCDIAATALKAIAISLKKMIASAAEQTGIKQILLMGGVMRNGYIRRYLKENIQIETIFSQINYSSDNACGIAMQARNLYKNKLEG